MRVEFEFNLHSRKKGDGPYPEQIPPLRPMPQTFMAVLTDVEVLDHK